MFAFDREAMANYHSSFRGGAKRGAEKSITRLSAMAYYVYLLASKKHGTLYLGVTNDMVRRGYEHRTKQPVASQHATASINLSGSKSMTTCSPP